MSFEAPTDQELAEKARTFYRICKPKAYREMKRDGTLEEVVRMKVDAAKSYAMSLMSPDMYPGQVWSRAIRLEILESETD